MKSTFSKIQKKVLELLLDKYENSKTYLGENQVEQKFAVLPSQVFAQYNSDYADVNLVSDFENQMKELENKELIVIQRDRREIEKLVANPEKWHVYYAILQREDKHTLQRKQKELYQSFLGKYESLDCFCLEQIERLDANKKAAYEIRDAEYILKLCRYILDNHNYILERELSIIVLGDSKLWEKKYRSKVCSLLRKYGDFEELLVGISDAEDQEDKREIERIILAEHLVFSNPSYVYFKGNAEFVFDSGQKIETFANTPLAFSMETMEHLDSVQVFNNEVWTIENLTSFNRMNRKNTFIIFLSGYHNSAKQKLIQKINDMNPGLNWSHFGDIDPDGFYIIEHLKRGTGIEFKPVYMNKEDLEKYKAYTKPLTNNDIRKANKLLHSGMYQEIMKYMLERGQKLEQEIISWMECR